MNNRMTRKEVADELDVSFKELSFLREAGQKEYAHTEDNAFANFERVGALLQIPREKVLMVYFLKHIDGIIAHINGHVSQREPVTGRISDAQVYLHLLRCMFKADERVNSPGGGGGGGTFSDRRVSSHGTNK